MTQNEALKLALEAHRKNERHRTLAETRYWCDQYKLLAQQAIKALAQSNQERNFCSRCGKRLGSNDWDVHTCTPPQPEQRPVVVMELYTVGWDLVENIDIDWLESLPFGTKLYAHPPVQKLGMTEDEFKNDRYA